MNNYYLEFGDLVTEGEGKFLNGTLFSVERETEPLAQPLLQSK